MKPPNVSIIIPALNEEKTIGKLIESLQKDPYPTEIIIVDGGSSDRTQEIAREKGARVIQEKGKRCPANARNQGAKVSDGEVLCFLDGDTEHVLMNFVTNAMKHFKKRKVVGVSVEEERITDSLIGKVVRSVPDIGLVKMFTKGKFSEFKPPRFVKKDVFSDIGGFPLLGFGEDRAYWRKLGKYIKNNDFKIVKEPSSKFFRHEVRSVGESFKRYEWYGRTVIPYIRTESKAEGLSRTALTLSPLVWLISMISIILISFFPPFLILSIPYLIKLIAMVYTGIKKNKFCFLIPLLDTVGGTGFLIGILSYLLGGRTLGR